MLPLARPQQDTKQVRNPLLVFESKYNGKFQTGVYFGTEGERGKSNQPRQPINQLAKQTNYQKNKQERTEKQTVGTWCSHRQTTNRH
jgi:hypothetical protein